MRTARQHNAAAGTTVADYRFAPRANHEEPRMSTQQFQGLRNVPAASERPVHEFDIPEDMQGPAPTAPPGAEPVKMIGLVELTPDEELNAARAAGGDAAGLAFQLWRYSLREVNGKVVSLGDGSTDEAVRRFTAQARQLAMTAYAEVNTPAQRDVASFLKSRRVKVG